MKITGLILAIIGLIGGVFCVVPFVQPDSPQRDVPGSHSGDAHRPNSAVPLAICGAAVVIGGLMFMYGGKGYYVSNNPSVRN